MNITNIIGIPQVGGGTVTAPVTNTGSSGQPTFLDVFTRIFGDAVEMSEISAADKIRLVLGEADDLEMIQLNKEKAGLAVELLTNVRNTVLDSYNEIIRMQI
ncbi:MAG: flagellar hook-basal body complex protein FliE [Oscillospiraceae bacterium]|nr:flagellar hook-basal body complex protein FliE [Oscillospiraceae bacterium]